MTAISSLEAHLGYWLRLVSNHVSQGFAAKLAVRGVTVPEWVLLRMLHGEAGAAPSALADAMGMTRGGITKLIDRMIARGLVTREAGGADKRYQSVSLTASGRALVPDLAALADSNDREWFGHLDPDEAATLRAALEGVAHRRGIRGAAVD